MISSSWFYTGRGRGAKELQPAWGGRGRGRHGEGRPGEEGEGLVRRQEAEPGKAAPSSVRFCRS